MGIKGAILGDIIGSPWEMNKCPNYRTVNLFGKRGFTDDTVLSIATKWAILKGKPYYTAYKLFYLAYPDRGFGRGFKHWATNHSTDFIGDSIGNGSAMRVSFIGEHFDTLEDVIKEARLSAATSHNTEDGILAAECSAVCVYLAKCGHSKQEIFEYIENAYSDYAGKDLEWYRKHYSWSVLARDTVHLAVICALSANSFEGALRNVLSVHCDADTVGAIAGSIAEELYGIPDDFVGRLKEYLPYTLYNIVMEK